MRLRDGPQGRGRVRPVVPRPAPNRPVVPATARSRAEVVSGPTILERISRTDRAGLVTGSPLGGTLRIHPTAVASLAPNLNPEFVRNVATRGGGFYYDPRLSEGGETRGRTVFINPNQPASALPGVFAHEGQHYRQGEIGEGLLKLAGIGGGSVASIFTGEPWQASATRGAKAAIEFLPHLAGGGYQSLFGNIPGVGNTGWQTLSNVPPLLKPFFRGLLR